MADNWGIICDLASQIRSGEIPEPDVSRNAYLNYAVMTIGDMPRSCPLKMVEAIREMMFCAYQAGRASK